MSKFAPGQMVVCTRTNDPKYSYLVHAVGEVRATLPLLLGLLVNADYEVYFPVFSGMRCPNCNKDHKGRFGMAHNELKPLDDPDEGKTTEDSEKLSPEFGFTV